MKVDLTRGIVLGNMDTGFEGNHNLTVRGKHYTSTAVLTTNGVEDVYITESSVDGDVFLDFIHRCVLPILMPFNGINPNSTVIMDNE